MTDPVVAARSRDEQPTEVMPSLPLDPPTPKRRRLIVFGALAACVLVGIATVIVLHGGGTATTPAHNAPVYTTRVVRTDLADTQSVPGTVGYGAARTVQAPAGTVTWMPAAGTVVLRNQQLLRVDDQPVSLFYGATPMFRDLDSPEVVGRDVRVIADNLSALGYAIGAQPRVGTMIQQTNSSNSADAPADSSTPPPPPTSTAPSTGQPAAVRVDDGDAVLTPALISAIKRWQRDTGRPRTGVLRPGDVIVVSGPVRVSGVTGQLGGPATVPLLSVTGTTKVITVPVDPTTIGSVNPGDTVSLRLPNGSTTSGSVTGVTAPPSSGSGGGADSGSDAGSGGSGSPGSITVTVTPNDPASVTGLDNGAVTVVFTTASRNGVLAVPVGALLALREGGYAVQVPGRGLVPVTTGMFARGMVQITAQGIVAGTVVVTTP